ncbi:hypothetical protein SDC9_136074 [bioreactor metagenome]|uniref:Uncharacterized protein n=1 Tax=bioreactor metagenome TaxID=1076179 RepID=A0A645DI25_9ZZZZ
MPKRRDTVLFLPRKTARWVAAPAPFALSLAHLPAGVPLLQTTRRHCHILRGGPLQHRALAAAPCRCGAAALPSPVSGFGGSPGIISRGRSTKTQKPPACCGRAARKIAPNDINTNDKPELAAKLMA